MLVMKGYVVNIENVQKCSHWDHDLSFKYFFGAVAWKYLGSSRSNLIQYIEQYNLESRLDVQILDDYINLYEICETPQVELLEYS